MKVALCSISSRKECCLKTILSLLRQSVRPEVHLFLSEESFLLDQGFPQKKHWSELSYLPVTIHWVPNWASYRKTVSFMKMFPDEVFMAVDDDEEFHPDFIKTILEHYKGGCLAFRATEYSDLPYNSWPSVMSPQTSVYYWSKGNGGVLYDSRLFQDKSFFDAEAFLKLAPTSDDVWVNLWRIRQKIPLSVLPLDHKPMPQSDRLWFYNQTKNDEMIKSVSQHLGV